MTENPIVYYIQQFIIGQLHDLLIMNAYSNLEYIFRTASSTQHDEDHPLFQTSTYRLSPLICVGYHITITKNRNKSKVIHF